ncbi:MAG TPA: hypothetical protein VGI74_27590 [Streptosporangiaceae bacterium]
MTPADALRWIRAKQGKGIGGCTIYCSRASLESVWAACRGHAYYIWVADWTDNAHAVRSTVATQYRNVDNAYDLSEVYSQQWLNTLYRVNHPWPL